jgi:hypothetical protein
VVFFLAIAACGDGSDVVLGIADGGYVPCGGKKCGDTCTYCQPGVPGCVELAVVKWCNVKGECLPGVEPVCP